MGFEQDGNEEGFGDVGLLRQTIVFLEKGGSGAKRHSLVSRCERGTDKKKLDKGVSNNGIQDDEWRKCPGRCLEKMIPIQQR